MGAFLLLPVLVSGFWFIHIHPILYYKLHRYEGQYLYLNSAGYGLVLYTFSAALIVAFSKYFTTADTCSESDILSVTTQFLCSTELFSSYENRLIYPFFILTSFVVVINAYIYVTFAKVFLYFTTPRSKMKLRILEMILKDSPMDRLLFSLQLNKKAVMLSMKDRKVYVGKVLSMGEPNESKGADQEIEILPVMSGFRDKDSMELTFTTYYEKINEDIILVLRQDEILTATEFNFDVYARLRIISN